MLRLSHRFNYFSTSIKKGLEDDYEALSALGQGSTSRVFLGFDVRDYHKVALKIFKKMDQAKIQRQISVLQDLKHCPSIIQLEAFFRNEGSNNYTFVMPHYPGITLNHLVMSLNLQQARSYVRDILTALSYIHAKGIMHRDIKASNVLVCDETDSSPQMCRVFDFGLAEYYKPGEQYKYAVGTKCYKPPELLLKQRNYTPMIDIWTTGVILAEMLFKVKPLFKHIDDEELMLKQVFKRCRNSWDILDENLKEKLGKVRYEPLNIQKSLCPKGADLAQKMMDANPLNRPTADQCLHHPFFKT